MCIEESSARTVCDDSISAERTKHHNDVPAGGQMVRGGYEFIPRARHRVGGSFDGRGFSNGHGVAQDPWLQVTGASS